MITTETGYVEPCPPHGADHPMFTLYVLDIKLGLAPRTPKKLAQDAMNGHILESGELTGRFQP